jgi:hypothetical protein
VNQYPHSQSPIVFTPDAERAAYRRVEEMMKRFNPGVDFIINRSTLRVEQALAASKNKYSFDLYENPGSDRPLERKLNRNDLFVITDLAMHVAKFNPTTGDYANYRLYTFPDPNYFSGLAAGVNEWESLWPLYNGEISVVTKPVQRLEGFLTSNLLYVPEKQTLLSTGDQLNDEPAQFGPTHQHRGFFSLQPNIILDGQENNNIELTLGPGQTTQIAGAVDNSGNAVTTRNVVIVQLLGFEVKNGAQKVNRWTAN